MDPIHKPSGALIMKKKKKFQEYERLTLLSIDEVFEAVRSGAETKNVMGHEVKLGSQRYRTFMRSLTCATCGVTGIYFAAERARNGNTERYHFNLYGVDASGEEILMTKDHIVPKSRGGKNRLTNYQTMCSPCNTEKGSRIE
jgi:hypothetical protein